ncbi:response regulator [Amylibacter ulvae]|uniref:Response regulator n=1 Tax=Paramylibacter ulvae TaxID=1651968 RepID=A0ABQ3D324_9RHOB|nr:hypothetical protein [Amylibacter ulvae]GHA56198.1 response regulator [Amylibacter ulvae]
MRVLVAEGNLALSTIWCRHLRRQGLDVVQALSQDQAMDELRDHDFGALILNLKLPESNVLAISDVATYRNPDIAIILVTADRFFSDGSIFDLVPNARSFVNDQVRPDDLAAMVDHYSA